MISCFPCFADIIGQNKKWIWEYALWIKKGS